MSADPIQRFVLLVLFQAQQDRATDLTIAPVGRRVRGPISYKVDGTWYDVAPPPEHILPDAIAEIGRLAHFNESPFPRQGLIDVPFGGMRLRWFIRMASADSACILTRAE